MIAESSYDGKQVVVTGCSSGIGASTVLELVELGARVVGLDRQEPSSELADFYQVDLGELGDFDKLARDIGRVDALFNCAGISGGSANDTTVMRVNFFGLRALTEALLQAMPDGGSVASVASLSALAWETRLSPILELLSLPAVSEGETWCREHPEHMEGRAYKFSKECVIVWSKFRSTQLGARRIRINTIGPGVTDTPILADSVKKPGLSPLESFPKPLGRIAAASEQARVLTFLNSDAASFVTGENIWVDGGYNAGVVTGQLPSWYD